MFFVVLYPAIYRIVIGSQFRIETDVASTSHPPKYAIIGVLFFLYILGGHFYEISAGIVVYRN